LVDGVGDEVIKIIYGLRKEEGKAGWRKLHTEDAHNFYFSLNSVRHIITSKMRWRKGSMNVMRLYMRKKIVVSNCIEDIPQCL